jgi:hypothetical protein
MLHKVIYVTFNYLINLYRDLMRLNRYNTTNNFQRELKRLKTDNQIIDNEKNASGYHSTSRTFRAACLHVQSNKTPVFKDSKFSANFYD